MKEAVVLNLSETSPADGDSGSTWRTCTGCGTQAPLAPDADRCSACTPQVPDVLVAADFTDTDLSDLWFAGCVFARAVAEVGHHEIGDPGVWDLYGTGPDEVARLRGALDLMQEAIREARGQLGIVERRARRRAARRPRGGRRSV
jgi:hypothetical protein